MKFLTLISLFTFFITTNSLFANSNKQNLISVAKEQRVLSQSIAKSYLLLAYGADLHEIKLDLNASIDKFEQNLNILRKNSTTYFSAVAQNIIKKEAMVWYNLKVNVEKTPTSENLNRVVELSNSLLKKSHLAYMALQTEYKVKDRSYGTIDSTLENLIKITDKQLITSERLCLYFAAQKMNVKARITNPKILGTLRSTVDKLEKRLLTLLETNINNPETTEIIDETLIVFEDIRTNKTDFLDGKPSMNTIYVTTKKLNKLLKKLSIEYTALSIL